MMTIIFHQKRFAVAICWMAIVLSSQLWVPRAVGATMNSAEKARWLVSQSKWGHTPSSSSLLASTDPNTTVTDLPVALLSFGAEENKGRIFFYLMGSHSNVSAALSLSEAAINPSLYEGARCGKEGNLDPEDPRCAKLTLSGTVVPCHNNPQEAELCEKIGKQALFRSHPQMQFWPVSHDFTVHEMVLSDLWMIASYGGGTIITPEEYHAATPRSQVLDWDVPTVRSANPRRGKEAESSSFSTTSAKHRTMLASSMQGTGEIVARARWIVAHSLWTTISTWSVRLDGKPWGNIRSIVDGATVSNGTGLPYFYLPKPDPTAADVGSNPSIVLSFSEAALAECRNKQGTPCGGKDAMDPTCAQLHLKGTAHPLSDAKDIHRAQIEFGARHPLAPWLAKGGAHTGGTYYTIDLESIVFLDNYGGAVSLSVNDYLSYIPPPPEASVGAFSHRTSLCATIITAILPSVLLWCGM